jgi:orotate phosphoribosyltransferase
MDTYLIKQIVQLGVPIFGTDMRNKKDSSSCMFDPRLLMSVPDILHHVGKQFAQIIAEKCEGTALMGIATGGIPWAITASMYSGLPALYIRKELERHMSKKHIEGIPPKEKTVILVDDLLYRGNSKNKTLVLLKEHGYTVKDILLVIDRQIQRKDDGPSLQEKWGLRLHSLVTMDEIVQYMIETQTITDEQLERLRADYQKYERWDIPSFARP